MRKASTEMNRVTPTSVTWKRALKQHDRNFDIVECLLTELESR